MLYSKYGNASFICRCQIFKRYQHYIVTIIAKPQLGIISVSLPMTIFGKQLVIDYLMKEKVELGLHYRRLLK